MSRNDLDTILAEIRQARTDMLTDLVHLTEADFAIPAEAGRWDDVRRLLLRLGDHMREHANQLADARQKLGRGPTMPQKMLAEGEIAWGKLLAETMGLTDADLDMVPKEGDWTVRQILAHILEIERWYQDHLTQALTEAGRPLKAEYRLSDAEIDCYHTNGYLGPFTAVSETEMAEIRAHIENDVLQRDGPSPRSRVQSRHMDSQVIYDLATHPAIIERMASIMGPNLIMWATNFFNKAPGGSEIPWHQDINFWPLEPPVNISAWIAIDNVTVENACVQLIPGSHKRMAPHIKAPEGMAFGQMIDPDYYDENQLINMELRPGQFFLFTERLMHHSNKNESNQRRMGMSIRVTLPMVTIDQDNPPLHPGHTAVLARGHDIMSFNRLAGRPTQP